MAASLAVLSLSGGAFCVEASDMPVYTLDGIVVTASRVPEKKIDSNADVSVVTAKEIEEKHYDDVSEAIRHVPGVNIANYSGSGQNYSTNRIYINGSSNVVVLVDGIRSTLEPVATAEHLRRYHGHEFLVAHRRHYPGLAHMFNQRLRLVLHQQVDRLDAGIEQVAQHEVDRAIADL